MTETVSLATESASSLFSPTDLPAVLEAGLLLAVIPCLTEHGLPCPSVAEVIVATGVSRARAYEVRNAILAALPGLLRPVGRPPSERVPAFPVRLAELTGEVRDHLLANPGSAEAGPLRRRYTDAFRHFVLELRDRFRDLDDEAFAQAVGVPLRTFWDWKRPGSLGDVADAPQLPPSPPLPVGDPLTAPPPLPVTIPPSDPARLQEIQTILHAWESWKGSFVAFCAHVNGDLRIPYRRTLIGRILEQHGVRIPRRRPGRSPDERALRKQFEIFFPGAQWSADGTPLSVEVQGQIFTFNLELVLDPASAAFVGMSIRLQEDSKAVVEAFDDGVATTGEPPLALLLDNRPSNHTEEVDEALGETLRQRATPFRPQNKAHSEGGFGLFAQTAPPLSVPSLVPAEIARTVLALVVVTWARTLNHRPRVDRDGKSRVDLYRAADPTPEEIEQARRALQELVQKQQQARETLQARQDPLVRQALDEAFTRFGLDDPEGNLRAAIGRYPLDHVVAGIAIFDGKRAANTLPPDVDARYLLGIVRNVSQDDEGIHIAEALWRGRLAARDRILLALDHQRELTSRVASDPLDLVRRLVDHAMSTQSTLDRSFWIRALADAITAEPREQHQALFRTAARRIHATHSIPHKARLAAVRHLAVMILPLS